MLQLHNQRALPRLTDPEAAERVMSDVQVVDAVWCPAVGCGYTDANGWQHSIAVVVRVGHHRRVLCPVCMGAYLDRERS